MTVLHGQLEPERWGICRLAGAAFQRRAQSPGAGAAPAAGPAAKDCGRRPGRARAPAISRSGAPTSIGSMASMPLQRLGQGGFRSAGAAAARRRAAQGRRVRDRRAASVASGRRPLAIGGERAACSPMWSQAGACAPGGGCRRSRWVPPRSIAMINRARFVLAGRCACRGIGGVAAVVDLGDRDYPRALVAGAYSRAGCCVVAAGRRDAGRRHSGAVVAAGPRRDAVGVRRADGGAVGRTQSVSSSCWSSRC